MKFSEIARVSVVVAVVGGGGDGGCGGGAAYFQDRISMNSNGGHWPGPSLVLLFVFKSHSYL